MAFGLEQELPSTLCMHSIYTWFHMKTINVKQIQSSSRPIDKESDHIDHGNHSGEICDITTHSRAFMHANNS